MDEHDLLKLFVRPLHDSGFRYLVAGSVGAMIYSEPRMTIDIDLVVAIPSSQIGRLADIFVESEFYLPPPEVILGENSRECRGHFNIIHHATGLKADFYPSHTDPFFAWAWRNRNVISDEHGPVDIAPPEYIIVWKTIYFSEGGSEKHLRDIRRMVTVSEDQIDFAVVRDALRERGLLEVFEQRVIAAQ